VERRTHAPRVAATVLLVVGDHHVAQIPVNKGPSGAPWSSTRVGRRSPPGIGPGLRSSPMLKPVAIGASALDDDIRELIPILSSIRIRSEAGVFARAIACLHPTRHRTAVDDAGNSPA